jgi:protein-L-isoaspartate O-methyltransferase
LRRPPPPSARRRCTPLAFHLLGLAEGDRLLELGAGTGYGAALAAQVVGPRGQVVSVEVDPHLVAAARANTAELAQVRIEHADGLARPDLAAACTRAWLTFSVPEVPRLLVDALPEGGVLLAPVGPPPPASQRWLRFERRDGAIVETAQRSRWSSSRRGLSCRAESLCDNSTPVAIRSCEDSWGQMPLRDEARSLMRRIWLIPVLGLACSSSGAPGGGTLAGYKPCDPATRVGLFTLQLVPPDPSTSTPGTAQIAGSIQNGVDPTQVWVAQASEGDCKLVGLPIPFCDPACPGEKPICAAQNKCMAEPMPQDVGSVTLGGLTAPATAMKMGARYYSPITMPYPPYGPTPRSSSAPRAASTRHSPCTAAASRRSRSPARA